MTAILTTAGGEKWQMPALLEWEFLRTDGSSCDSARFTFLYEPKRVEVLKKATRFQLTEDSKTVLCGVVDEFTASVGPGGRLVTVTGRGMAALLMDNELRAAEYALLQKEDALNRFARDFGVVVGPSGSFPAVRNFAVGTGLTAWKALCGFCRHSKNARPRFTADGTLLPDGGTAGQWELTANSAFRSFTLRQYRYGVISRQLMLSARSGLQEDRENAAFKALGGSAVKVGMKQDKYTPAGWRNAAQCIEDSMEEAVLLTVTMAGRQEAEPGDRVAVYWSEQGVTGTYTLRSRRECYDGRERTCTLELKGVLG